MDNAVLLVQAYLHIDSITILVVLIAVALLEMAERQRPPVSENISRPERKY